MKKRMLLTFLLSVFTFSCFFNVSEAKEVIHPGLSAPKITLVTRKGKGKTKVTWNKVGKAAGYELQYGTKQDFSKAKTKKLPKNTTVQKSFAFLSNKKDTYFRVRAYDAKGRVSQWSAPVQMIVWNKGWKYAKYSKIHSDPAFLYYAKASKTPCKTVAVNAGHGTKNGSSKKTLCHPDGSKKVTGGTTASGAKYAIAVSEGTTVGKISEAEANLRIAKKLKSKLLAAGYNVLMIRQDSNTQLDNVARTVIANNNADCHIAIHFDGTKQNKGAFYLSVPNVSSYRKMQPVKSNWKKHHKLGKDLIQGLKGAGVKIWGSGSMAMDLTQTSYSTISSVDIEVGDQKTSTSDKNLNKIAKGLLKGIKGNLK